MAAPGRLVSFVDSAGQHGAFVVCQRCTSRLDRLPVRLQHRQLDAAIRELAKHPERYQVQFFPDKHSAWLFTYLEAERLRLRPS